MYSIYKYTNSLNGKVYIGQTTTSLKRRARENGKNYCQCPKFYNAIQKYSWDVFVPEVLETVETQEKADEREQYYIDLYKSTDDKYGYNIALGGYNNGANMSEETKHLISERAKERYKDKTKNPMYGKKHSEESIRKMREAKLGKNNPMYGTKWTETQREKCGTKGKKLNLSDEQRENLRLRAIRIGQTHGLRPVECIETGEKFKSVTEAAHTFGVNPATLCGQLNGSQKTCAGKHFKYLD